MGVTFGSGGMCCFVGISRHFARSLGVVLLGAAPNNVRIVCACLRLVVLTKGAKNVLVSDKAFDSFPGRLSCRLGNVAPRRVATTLDCFVSGNCVLIRSRGCIFRRTPLLAHDRHNVAHHGRHTHLHSGRLPRATALPRPPSGGCPPGEVGSVPAGSNVSDMTDVLGGTKVGGVRRRRSISILFGSRRRRARKRSRVTGHRCLITTKVDVRMTVQLMGRARIRGVALGQLGRVGTCTSGGTAAGPTTCFGALLRSRSLGLPGRVDMPGGRGVCSPGYPSYRNANRCGNAVSSSSCGRRLLVRYSY